MSKPAPAKPRNELARLTALSKLTEDDKIREIRKLESRLITTQADLRILQQKYKQTQQDLQITESNIERMLAGQDQLTIQKLERSRKRKGRGRASAILCVNDWHIEENVDPTTIDGIDNKFNPQIAAKRINNTWEKALYLIDFISSISNITELIIWAGGELINGYIHEEMEESNFAGPGVAALEIQDHLATGLDYLSKYVKVASIVFLGNFGNHGRTTKHKRIATGWQNSWEWSAYQSLAGFYSKHNSKIKFKIAKGDHLWFPVQGHDVRFHHGDCIKFGGGIGGVHIPLRKKIAQWNKQKMAAFDVLGHFHQYAEDWNYVLCGCLVGPNAYAVARGFELQPPTQTLIIVDYEHGKTMSLPVYCGD
jgi:hypothetical protein